MSRLAIDVGALLLVLLIASGGSPVSAGQSLPGFNAQMSSLDPGATASITLNIAIPADARAPDVTAIYIPAAWDIAPGTANSIGTYSALIDTETTLGLLNSPCNLILPIHWDFRNASVDRANPVAMDDEDGNSTPDFADDVDGNSLEDGIDRYPDFLDNLIEETPIRRLAGVTIVAGIHQLYQIVIFEPGTDVFPGLPSDVALGYPTLLLINDAAGPSASPSPGAITDDCAPRVTNLTLLGVANGLANPATGQHKFSLAYLALPDADNDGYENRLDTCPLNANVGNPKTPFDGDLDSDGLDAACDPIDDPALDGTNSDQDADGYVNRQDNCPLTPDGPAESNQVDSDRDGIGDHCDPSPSTVSGTIDLVRAEWNVRIGDAPAVWGDLDCDGNLDTRDHQGLLRAILGQDPISQLEPCPDIGTSVTVGSQVLTWGDLDCSGDLTTRDSQALLRKVLFQPPLSQTEPCPDPGSAFSP